MLAAACSVTAIFSVADLPWERKMDLHTFWNWRQYRELLHKRCAPRPNQQRVSVYNSSIVNVTNMDGFASCLPAVLEHIQQAMALCPLRHWPHRVPFEFCLQVSPGGMIHPWAQHCKTGAAMSHRKQHSDSQTC
jgi:hypothetical protein